MSTRQAKIWITRWVFTKGVVIKEAKIYQNGNAVFNESYCVGPTDYAFSREAALKQIQDNTLKAVGKVKKKLAKLERVAADAERGEFRVCKGKSMDSLPE